MKIIYIIGLFFWASCTNSKLLLENFPGNYTSKGKDYTNDILINKDGSFLYKRKSLEISSECNGTWKYLGGDSIRITCNKTADPLQSISSGYMGEYSEKIVLLSKNQIKLNNIILKRK